MATPNTERAIILYNPKIDLLHCSVAPLRISGQAGVGRTNLRQYYHTNKPTTPLPNPRVAELKRRSGDISDLIDNRGTKMRRVITVRKGPQYSKQQKEEISRKEIDHRDIISPTKSSIVYRKSHVDPITVTMADIDADMAEIDADMAKIDVAIAAVNSTSGIFKTPIKFDFSTADIEAYVASLKCPNSNPPPDPIRPKKVVKRTVTTVLPDGSISEFIEVITDKKEIDKFRTCLKHKWLCGSDLDLNGVCLKCSWKY